MWWPFSLLERVPKTPAEELLGEVTALLFPPLLLRTDEKGRKFHLDYSMDTNLQAVLQDLETGYNDEATRRTLVQLIDRVSRVRQLTGTSYYIDSKAEYFVVDSDLFEEDPVEDRVQIQEEDLLE